MIIISPLRLKRFTVQLKELSIRDCIALSSIPEHMQHESASFFLSRAIESVEGLSDFEQWTVQERTMVICHYMSGTYDDGPDFKVGELNYSDYLAGTEYAKDDFNVGEVGGNNWTVTHLTGRIARSLERLVGEVEGLNDYAYWQIALMAAQMTPSNVDSEYWTDDEGLSDSDLDVEMLRRISAMAAFPESSFTILWDKWVQANTEIGHLINMSFNDKGMLCLSVPKEEVLGIYPARFPASSVITTIARRLGGKFKE